MSYGNRLKWLIKNKGYSQREVAAALGVPESTLSGWTLMDYPAIDSIEAVCKVLQVPLSRFFSDPESDTYIEVSAQERQLLKLFGEFPEEKRPELLRIVEVLKGF